MPFDRDGTKAVRIAPLTSKKITSDVAFCVNACTHAVHAIAGWAGQASEQGRANLSTQFKTWMVERHENPSRSVEARWTVKSSRRPIFLGTHIDAVCCFA